MWLVVDALKKHNVIRTIITLLLPIWLSFGNTYLGEILFLKENNKLTLRGWIVNIIVLLINVAINVLVSFIPEREKKQSEEKDLTLKTYKDTIAVNESMLEITSDLCTHKLSLILENTNENLDNGLSAFKPIQNLQEISYKIRKCVADITGIPKKKIVVSMLYRLKDENEWKWVNESELITYSQSGGKNLVTNPCSTFYYVLNNVSFVVFNDKLTASKNKQYVLDENDNSHKKNGSISCNKFVIPVENNCITVLLSISTYGSKFVENDSEKDIDIFTQNLNDKVLSQFNKRISLELITLYLQIYKMPNKPSDLSNTKSTGDDNFIKNN